MIEREFVAQKVKEYNIKKYIEGKLSGVGISQIKLKKIPLGEKIIIYTSRPSLLVGSKGANIRDLTKVLKKEFKLENPQIEINEVKDIYLDANVVAERIAGSLERFGSARFKGIGHKTMENVLSAGALGVEVIISGKIPGARAKSWRFYQGYLKKCGDVAIAGVRKSKKIALLKSGIIGIQVSIMPPDLVLPDTIELVKQPIREVEELKDGKDVKDVLEVQPEVGQDVSKEQEHDKAKAPKKKVIRKRSPKKEEKATREDSQPVAETTSQTDAPTEESPAAEASKSETEEHSP